MASKLKDKSILAITFVICLLLSNAVILQSFTRPAFAQQETTDRVDVVNYPFYDPDICYGSNDAKPAPTNSSPEAVLALLRALPLRERIAEMLIVGFTDSQQAKDITAKQHAKDIVAKYQIGGVFLQKGANSLFNKAAIDEVKAAGKIPVLVATDQEGGKVQRLDAVGITGPSAKSLGKQDNSTITAQSKAMAQKMAALGITVDFAPVIDLDNGKNPIISKLDRAFSGSPDVVAEKSQAFAQGLRDGGITPVYKHFPGHGSADKDSHLEPTTTPPIDQLKANDLKPYETIQNSGTAGVMVGHLIVPGLTNGVQATISKPAVDLLRNDYHFDQLVFSDDLAKMQAILKNNSLEQAVSLSIQAGVDMPILALSGTDKPIYKNIDSTIKAIIDQVESDVKAGKISEDRINQSMVRIAKFIAGNQPLNTPAAADPAQAAPATTVPAAAAGGSIYVLGDSLTVGLKGPGGIEAKLAAAKYTATVNGQGSRPLFYKGGRSGPIIDGFTAVQNDKDIIKTAGTIVVGLGTNKQGGGDGEFRDKVGAMIDTLRSLSPGARILWTNPAGSGKTDTYKSYDTILDDLSKSKKFEIVDWASIAGQYLNNDVHPNAAGYDALAKKIVEKLGGAAPIITPTVLNGGCKCSAGSGTTQANLGGNAPLKDRQRFVYDFFVGKGYKPWQAAGIIGNMMHESGVEPQRLQSTKPGTITPAQKAIGSSQGWGLVQFTPAGKFISTVQPIEKANDILTQLNFISEQLEGRTPIAEKVAGKEIKSTGNVEEATKAFQGTKKAGGIYYGYERPKDEAGSLPSRIASAQAVLAMFGSGGPTSSPTPATEASPVSSCAQQGHDGTITVRSGPPITMVDSVQPVPNPGGADVMAGYVKGHGQSRAWTSGDWDKAKRDYKYLLPIYVAFSSFSTPIPDADDAVAQVKAIGLTPGSAIALDIEAKVATRAASSGYVAAWSNQIKSDGFVPIIYTSLSTGSVVPAGILDWLAYTRTGAVLDGHAAHQYAFKGAYDLSVIDPSRVPLWPTHPAGGP